MNASSLESDAALSESLPVRLALPKGRMFEGVRALLADAGIGLKLGAREYRPEIGLPGFEVKLLKPQAIVAMLQAGSRDLGFSGADWVAELQAEDLVELLDTGLDPVRVVAAAPAAVIEGRVATDRPLTVVSEMEHLARQWMARRGLQATFLRSFGATEVYPPEDADWIVDVVATGSTLRANQLVEGACLMRSSTRLYARRGAMDDPEHRRRIESFTLLLKSVLEARVRVMLELNVEADRLETMVRVLPCMREPTISPLHGDAGYAVKVAIRRSELPSLIPQIKAMGGTDIVVSQPSQIVP